jgi:hypothetical protein
MSDGEIDIFVDEIREAAKVRGLITEAHIEIIRSVLVRAYDAADESGEFLELWDSVRDLIANKSMPVKARLLELGRIGELLDERCRGRTH